MKGKQDMGCGTAQVRSKERGCARSQLRVKPAIWLSSGYWAGGRGCTYRQCLGSRRDRVGRRDGVRMCILGTWKILDGLYDKEAGVVTAGGDRTGSSIELVCGVRRGRWWLLAFAAKAMWMS